MLAQRTGQEIRYRLEVVCEPTADVADQKMRLVSLVLIGLKSAEGERTGQLLQLVRASLVSGPDLPARRGSADGAPSQRVSGKESE